MRSIIIPADINEPIREIELDSLAERQQAVGGYIEAIPVPTADEGQGGYVTTAYVNEDGKYTLGNALNSRATAVWVLSGILPSNDYIAGNVIICGLNTRTGDTCDCKLDTENVEFAVGLVPEAILVYENAKMQRAIVEAAAESARVN